MKEVRIMYTKKIWDNSITIDGCKDVFSPNDIDTGTITMLNLIELNENDKVLDLGCGTGVVGVAIAKQIGADKIVMADIDDKALECSRSNLELNEVNNVKLIKSNGFENIEDFDFTMILSNPPYHTNFSVAKHFIESGKKHLKVGGRFILVVKRLDWYKNKMTTVFGGISVHEKNGYYVMISEKKDNYRKSLKQAKPIKKKHLKKIQASNNRKSYRKG
jgi:16S rRNA (guanine1207-N2)-methyltransferase